MTAELYSSLKEKILKNPFHSAVSFIRQHWIDKNIKVVAFPETKAYTGLLLAEKS